MSKLSKESILVVFDLDGTLTTHHSSWQFVLEQVNKWEPDGKKNLELFLNGKLIGKTVEDQYITFCKLDAELLKGLEIERFYRILRFIQFRANIQELMYFFTSKLNSETIIISAGFQELANIAKSNYGFNKIVANRLLHKNGFLNGEIEINVSWSGKRDVLLELIKKYNLTRDNVISFGDTTGDIEMFKESGLSFACFEANDNVIAKADHHITNFLEVPNLVNKYLK